MSPTTRTLVAVLVLSAATTSAAAAAPSATSPDVSRYAAAVRTINPRLPEPTAQRYARSVLTDAAKLHLDPRFLMAIVTVESHWSAGAVSRVGARGLGQLMPSTARTLRVNAWDPTDNLRGTSHYLRRLLDTFRGSEKKNELAIAAYNAGPHAVQRFGGIPPFAETQRYVVKVMSVWNRLIAHVAPPAAAATALATSNALGPDVSHWLPANPAQALPVQSAPAPDAPAAAPAEAAPPAVAPADTKTLR